MSRKIYVNVPVEDLGRSVEFFTRLGFEFDTRMTDENATCMIVNDEACFMLLVRDFFKSFTGKDIGDPAAAPQAIYALTAGDRPAVDTFVDTALAAGATPAGETMDHGYMYGRSFRDLDGHMWEVFYMDEAAAEAAATEAAGQ